MRVPPLGLYVLTPDGLGMQALVDAVTGALDGGAAMVQVRQKGGAPAPTRARAEALLTLCRSRGVPLIVNDDCALAAAIGADGVHVGREDAAIDQARSVLGDEAIVGASCYDSIERAHQAVAAGASYVAFGSVFASPTKPSATRAALSLIAQARAELSVPICAIGGITADNAGPVIAAGAGLLAVISDVFGAADPRAAALRYRPLFAPSAIRHRPPKPG